MIIRLSVNDNDFSGYLTQYMQKFSLYMRELTVEFDYESEPEKLRDFMKRDRYIRKVLNPNNIEPLSGEDIDFIIQQVHFTFGVFCDKRFDLDVADYLKKQLSVSILSSIEDRWENGEAFYWFLHANNFINL